MARDTRRQFLDKAEELFAARGFYGVSLAAIADELGLTKQALLHHFAGKEKLYGEVLARISDRFNDLAVEAGRREEDPRQRLVAFFTQLQAAQEEAPAQTRLLMRELLDNKQRVEAATTWYLKPFLQSLIAMVQAVPNWHDAGDMEALALVYQWLGAINYYAVSHPTLTGIFGSGQNRALTKAFVPQLSKLMLASLDAREAAIASF